MKANREMNMTEYLTETWRKQDIADFQLGSASKNGKIIPLGIEDEKPQRIAQRVLPDPTASLKFSIVNPTASPEHMEKMSVPIIDEFEREREAFLRLEDSLLGHETYRGKFVALHGGTVVDVDVDKRELAKRVYARFGYIPIYIGRVERTRRVVDMPSPEGP